MATRGMLECSPGRVSGRFRETRETTPAGAKYDLYDPPDPEHTFIAVPGLVIRGAREPRLLSFVRTMAESKLRVAAIELPSLAAGRFERSDLEAIIELGQTLHARSQRPIGMTAFSFGAGLALRAAVDPRAAGVFDPLILFGPYHDLASQWDRFLAAFRKPPTTDLEWENHVWLMALLLWRRRAELHLTPVELLKLEDLLANYCAGPSLADKIAFYRSAIAGRTDRLAEDLNRVDRTTLDELSPAGRLSSYPGRVALLHDANDDLIDPNESRRIFQELRPRQAGGKWLVVTPLLSHVTATRVWRVFSLIPIFAAMGEMFRGEKA